MRIPMGGHSEVDHGRDKFKCPGLKKNYLFKWQRDVDCAFFNFFTSNVARPRKRILLKKGGRTQYAWRFFSNEPQFSKVVIAPYDCLHTIFLLLFDVELSQLGEKQKYAKFHSLAKRIATKLKASYITHGPLTLLVQRCKLNSPAFDFGV